MAFFKILFIILTYFKSSIKLAIYGDAAIVETIIISVLNIVLIYLHFSFNNNITEEYTGGPPGFGQQILIEETEEVEKDDEIEIPDAFKKEYNFLSENSKSLTTLFENYILRRVSHDTLLRQFQASQENTFLQMKSRVRTELDVRTPSETKGIAQKEKRNSKSDELCRSPSDDEISDEQVFTGLPIFGSGDMQKKLMGIKSPAVLS